MKIHFILVFSLLSCLMMNIEAQNFVPNNIDSIGHKTGMWSEFRIPYQLLDGEVLIKLPEIEKEYYSLKKGEDRKYFPIIECVGNYENGLKTGEWVEYYWNDTICSRINYKEGIPYGYCVKFWINGKLKLDFTIENSNSIPVSHYDENGVFFAKKMILKRDLIQLIYTRL
ncbi:MAG: hypothetical protein PF694_10990 [Bacteroidetes bacterium]|nr:hypothetical protein [Bacteroidota bacterium]